MVGFAVLLIVGTHHARDGAEPGQGLLVRVGVDFDPEGVLHGVEEGLRAGRMRCGHSCAPIRATAPASAVTALSGLRIDPWPAVPSAISLQPGHSLLGCLDQIEPQVVAHGEREPTDLADRLGAVGEQLRVVVDEPVRTKVAAGLLVGGEDQPDRTSRRAVRCGHGRAPQTAPWRRSPSCRPHPGPRRNRQRSHPRTGRPASRPPAPAPRLCGRGSAAAARTGRSRPEPSGRPGRCGSTPVRRARSQYRPRPASRRCTRPPRAPLDPSGP